MAKAILEHPVTKIIKVAPVDNWNFFYLLLPSICCIVRGDVKTFLLVTFVPFYNIYLWLAGVNKYNFWYIKSMLEKGYKIKNLPPTMSPEMLCLKIGIPFSSSYFVS